jgi:hypothetical protein
MGKRGSAHLGEQVQWVGVGDTSRHSWLKGRKKNPYYSLPLINSDKLKIVGEH